MGTRTEIHKALLSAAESGDVQTVTDCIDRGADVNAREETWLSWTPLHYAARTGHDVICNILLQAGADVNAVNKRSLTPLHHAALSGHDVICNILLQAGANVNAVNEIGNSPLHNAARMGKATICDLLIQAGADVLSNNSGDSPLHCAARNGNANICDLLIKAGEDALLRNNSGDSPLHCAARIGNANICDLLIKAGADALVRNNGGKTPQDLLPRTSGKAVKIIKQAEKTQRYERLKIDTGTKPINVVKLFLIGDPKAGKTTLQKALVQKRRWWKRDDKQRLPSECEDYQATPGIDLRKQRVPGAGTFAFWDCAGQLEYHVTHAMFLGAQNSVYILAYDVTKPHQLRELRRWLAFVKAGHDYSYQTKPDVVIVATHLDQMTSRADGEGQAESILQQMKSEFTNHLNISSDVIAINSLMYASEAVNRLRDVLDNLAKRIKGSRTIPLLCEKIMQQKNDWHEQGSYPIISRAKFHAKVKAIYGLADDTLLEAAADVLTDMSEIYVVKHCGQIRLVVLEPSWLSRAIIGPMFAGVNFPSDICRVVNKKMYTERDISEILPDAAGIHDLLDLLQHLELVYRYDQMQYIIPAKLPVNLDPVVWSNDPNFTEYYGRRVECKDDTDIFTPDVFPSLQVCIMKSYCDRQEVVHISRHALKFSGKIEGLVQLTSDQKAIHICVRGRSSQDRGHCYSQLEHVLEMVHVELEQRSRGTAITICHLSPTSLRQHDDLEGVSYYSEDCIESAKEGIVSHPDTANSDRVTDILCVGYDSRFLQQRGVQCSSIWLLEDDVQALCHFLDDKHPLGKDYRALAEALGVSEVELASICRQTNSATRALLDECKPSVGQLRDILQHPGLVGNEEAAQVIDTMLERCGHQVNDQESRNVVAGFKPDHISDEVLEWRKDLRQRASSLRETLDLECLLESFTHMNICDKDEIKATQQSLGRSNAVNVLLYKVIKMRNVELYQDLYKALETQRNTTTEVIPDAAAKSSHDLLDPHSPNITEKRFRYLGNKLGSEWEQLGTDLGIEYARLYQIKMDNHGVQNQIFSMLKEWQQKGEESSVLVDSLSNIGRSDLAGWLAKQLDG